MDSVIKEQKYYQKLWRNMKGGYSGDDKHWTSRTPNPGVVSFVQFLVDQGKKNKEKNSAKEKRQILDLGCGNGRHTVLFAKQGFSAYGIDFSENAINIAKRTAKENDVKIKYKAGSVLELPYKDNEFDVMLDAGCFHHLRKYCWKAYLNELNRTLKSGGYYCLLCFSINSDTSIPKFTKYIKKNWSVRKGHYNRLFKQEEIKEIFNQRFDILKVSELSKGDFPLLFWVVIMRKK